MRFSKILFSGTIVSVLFLLFPLAVSAQTHPEVLVVYNTNSADSLAVANHYMTARNIPGANLCAISPPSTDSLSLSDYTTYVKTPVQRCLSTAGSKNILYIVLSYLTPYKIDNNGPLQASAIDSYLADVWDKYATQPFLVIPTLPQPYYADSQSQGNVYVPFQSLASYRTNPRNPLIYSVWRLDGPSATIASALVDQAIAAENQGGPYGQACIDQYFGDTTNLTDGGLESGDFDLHQAAVFLEQAGVPVVDDLNGAEFGTSPAPLTCANTAFYSGWYSYYNYNDAFTWQTGSIGWHLDSASALSPRSGGSWVPNALQRGVAVTTGSITEPYLEGLVRPGGTFRNLLEGASVGDAFFRNTRWIKWQILYVGDPLYKPFPAGRAPFHPLQPVNSFQISPQEIVGGTNATGTITLSAAAPSGGTTFTLSAPAGFTIPATVKVNAGATKASFPITTPAVMQAQSVYSVLGAVNGALTLKNTITTDPLLGGLGASPGATMAGLPVSILVLLNGRAPAGGATISLSSDNGAITVPGTCTVAAGAASAACTATSTPVASTVTANISGTYAGVTQQIGINVFPAIAGVSVYPTTISAGGSTVFSISLGTTVPAGHIATIHLTSSDPSSLPVPPSMTIPAGSSYGNFIAGSTAGSSGKMVTITATYGGATLSTTLTIN